MVEDFLLRNRREVGLCNAQSLGLFFRKLLGVVALIILNNERIEIEGLSLIELIIHLGMGEVFEDKLRMSA